MDPAFNEYTIERESGGIVFRLSEVPELQDDISDAEDAARANGYDAGLSDGRDEGYAEAEEELAKPGDIDARTNDLRSELYRAVYAGDMEKAEDAINLMAMIDIDRDLIFQAKAEVRRG